MLHRGEREKILCFLMLNPSIANDKTDDPTIRRCLGFMESLGYRGLLVVNAFSFITPYPDELEGHILYDYGAEISNKENKYICEAFRAADKIIFAYGSHRIIKWRPEVRERLAYLYERAMWLKRKVYCLKETKEGYPSHPLYLKKDLKPVQWFPSQGRMLHG